jgi:xylulokinase
MASALGIDVGSSNVKVALVRGDGSLAATASRPLAIRQQGAVAEQDAHALWAAVASAVAEVAAAARDEARGVAAIGVCSQYSSTVPVDARGIPTAPCVTYFDTRGTDHSRAILQRHPEAFGVWAERHGIPPVGDGLSLAHVLHFQHDRPDVHAATAAYLEPVDYVVARLTGRITATACTMFPVQLCDNRRPDACAYDADLVRMAGVDEKRLPPLLPVDGIAGELGAAVAAELGLPAGACVPVGMNDSHAAALATGARGARAGLMIGTTGVLLAEVDRPKADLEHALVSMPCPVPGHYLVSAENGVAGKSVEHALLRLLLADDLLARSRPDAPFAALDAALSASPAGAGGVLFLPWLAGSLSPRTDRAMRGAFLNLSFETQRLDLVRAAVEGTARNLRWLLPAVERMGGCRISEIVFAGGAARSPAWAQIVADVLERPVRALAEPEFAVARAVAGFALRRARGVPGHGAPDLAAGARRFDPDPATHEVHARMQERFEAAFQALQPLQHAFHESSRGAPAER